MATFDFRNMNEFCSYWTFFDSSRCSAARSIVKDASGRSLLPMPGSGLGWVSRVPQLELFSVAFGGSSCE